MKNKTIHQEELQEDFNIDDYIHEDSKRKDFPITLLLMVIIFIIITIFGLSNYLFGYISGDSRSDLNNNTPLTTVVENVVE